MRNNYCNQLKSTCSNFPYIQDAELKRRMFTRTGDPVGLRLAQYIYASVEVADGRTDGRNPVVVKGMISTGRGLKCRYVVFGVGIGIKTIRRKTNLLTNVIKVQKLSSCEKQCPCYKLIF